MHRPNSLRSLGLKHSSPAAEGSTRIRAWLGSALAACATLGSVSLAHAQSGYFYLDRVQISGAPEDGFTVFRPYVSKGTGLFGTATVGYSMNPLRADTVTRDPIIENAIDNPVKGQLNFYGTAGLQLFGRLSGSVTLPVTLLNITGSDPQDRFLGTGGIGDHKTALQDLRIDLRVRSYESNDGSLRLGGGFALFAPTGNPDAFASDDQMTGFLFGSAEIDLEGVLLSGHIGPHFRPERSFGGDNGALFVGTELRWAFGAYVPMREGALRVGGELFGSTGLDSSAGTHSENTIFNARNTDLEWLAQARFLLKSDEPLYMNVGGGTRLAIGYGAPDLRVLFSIGKYVNLIEPETAKRPPTVHIEPRADNYDLDTDHDGYPDAVDKCPMQKEDGNPPDPGDGCPGVPDSDKDGIPDPDDKCPDKAEDKDGIQDEDGCPEEDADNDHVPDTKDKCPLQPGPLGEVAETAGCPTLTRLSDTGEVQLLQPIEFEPGKAVIKPASYAILDEVVTLLSARPELRLGVYGHTDNRGALPMNMRLSGDRAAACMKYLVGKGIDAGRLESAGYGPNQPVADNTTDEGRSRNRRVEFKVLTLGQTPEPEDTELRQPEGAPARR